MAKNDTGEAVAPAPAPAPAAEVAKGGTFRLPVSALQLPDGEEPVSVEVLGDDLLIRTRTGKAFAAASVHQTTDRGRTVQYVIWHEQEKA